MRISHAPGPIRSEPDARAAFDRAWKEAIAPALVKHRPKAHGTWQRVLDGEHHRSVRQQPCAELAERVRSTLGPTEMDSILLGELADLDGPDTCWTMTVSSGFMTLMVAQRASDGSPLLVYWPPEG